VQIVSDEFSVIKQLSYENRCLEYIDALEGTFKGRTVFVDNAL